HLSSRHDANGHSLTGAQQRVMIDPSPAGCNEGFPMSRHEGPGRRVVWLGVTLMALLGASGTAIAGDKEAPKPLPPEIVKAWEKAGAKVGWMGPSQFELAAFRSGGGGKVGEVPAFSLESWKRGLLTKLPPPSAPFGLSLYGTEVTAVGLKELAAFG